MLHLLFESGDGNSELKGKRFPLGKNIYAHLKETLDNYKGDKSVEGYKRLVNIINMDDNEGGILYNEMKRIKNFFDNYNGSKDSVNYILNGGEPMENWVRNTLNTAIETVKGFKQAKAMGGLKNSFRKEHTKDRVVKPPKETKIKMSDINKNLLNVAESGFKITKPNKVKSSVNEGKTFYITEEQQRRLLNESAADRFIDKLILKNLPERAKGLINTPLNVIAKEHPEALNGVALNENPEVMQKYGNLPLKDFIRVSIMQMFDIGHGKGPKKYLRGIFRIMLDEIRCLSNPDMNRINQLKDDVMYIMQASQNGSDPEASQMDGDLNGMSLTQINQTFKEKRKAFFANIRNKLSSTFKGKSNAPRYEKVVITNHDQCVKYAPYVGWCITFNSSANYDTYTQGGRRFYLFLREGYQNVRCEVGDNCPFDEYGMSMVSVLVDMDGNISIITTRWNHEHDGELNNPSQEQIEMVMNLMGVNLYKECPPYTRDELRAMGITPFEDVPELLAQGVDPKEIFDYVGGFNINGIIKVKLNGKYNAIDNGNNLLSPIWVDGFYPYNSSYYNAIDTNVYFGIKLDNKWNFINTKGQILYKPNEPDKWFNDVSDSGFEPLYSIETKQCLGYFTTVELNNGFYDLRSDGILCSKYDGQPIPELNESKTTKHTFYITEEQTEKLKKNMLNEEIIKKNINSIINEELSISKDVEDISFEIFSNIKKHGFVKGEENFSFNVGDILVSCFNYYFNSREEYEKEKPQKSANSVSHRGMRFINIALCYLSGHLVSNDLYDSIFHEVEHLYQQEKSKLEFQKRKDDDFYHFVEGIMYNGKTLEGRTVAAGLYLSFDYELNGYLNGLYGQLKESDPQPNEVDKIVKESALYQMISHAEEALKLLSSPDGDKYAEPYTIKYNLPKKYLINRLKKTLKTAYKKIGKIIVRFKKNKLSIMRDVNLYENFWYKIR